MRMKPRPIVTGTSPKPIIWNPGATSRAYDGTVTILQPLIAPLYSGKSAHEILAAVAGRAGRDGLRNRPQYWKGQNRRRTLKESGAERCMTASLPEATFAAKAVGLTTAFLPTRRVKAN